MLAHHQGGVLNAAPCGTEASFYRSSVGAEIGLVLKMPNNTVWSIEVKRITAAKVTHGFHIAADDLNASERILVYAGDRDIPEPKGVRAIPLWQA